MALANAAVPIPLEINVSKFDGSNFWETRYCSRQATNDASKPIIIDCN